MYPHETYQTNGATVNSWMRGTASAVDATAPAATVSVSDRGNLFSNTVFAQQTHPVGTMSGMAPALQNFATPMVSGSLESRFLRDPTHPISHQVHRSRRVPAAIFPPSPAPNFPGTGNVFSGGERSFAANVRPALTSNLRPAYASAVPLHEYGQVPLSQQQFPVQQQPFQLHQQRLPPHQFPRQRTQFPGTAGHFPSTNPREESWGLAPEQSLQHFSSSFPTSTALANQQIGTLSNVAPNPVASLAYRLRPRPKSVQDAQEERCSMKTVDAVLKDWVKPFSGEESEHWMEHINTLERKFAVKHKWIPRQFYFAIEGTLTGKAPRTIHSQMDSAKASTRLSPTS